MNSIKEKLEGIKNEIPTGCVLVAVSKTKPTEDILEAYNAGQIDFGENKVQELVAKAETLPKNIHWHMIGHLQRNKVKYIASFVHLIHGVDSLKLLKEVNKQGAKCNRTIDCLLQVHIASEEAKFGFDRAELQSTIQGEELAQLQNIRIVGLMGIATNTPNQTQIAEEFNSLKHMFDWTKNNSNLPHVDISILSMGMSGDYKIAINEGSNMVRIGSSIFGARN